MPTDLLCNQGVLQAKETLSDRNLYLQNYTKSSGNGKMSFGHTVVCRVLVSQSGIKPEPPAVETWSSNHCTTREFPGNSKVSTPL